MSARHPIPAAALDQPSCLVGTVGSGKTYAAKSAVEILLREGRRVIVVDPTGVWHGLRTRADGSPGFPIVIFGGEQADVPVAPSPEAGAALGDLLASDAVTQAIVDVSEMTGGERTRFLTALLERLFAGPRVPRHLILDEADEMAPQNPFPEQARLLGIVDKIVRRGRVRGFRPMMITQRPAVLAKNVLSQIATLVAMRLTSPQDRKAIEGWVKGSADLDEAKAVLASLPKLAVGEGWVWAPREDVLERVRFPAIATLDTSATPATGAAPTGPRAMAPVDVAALREAMSVAEPAPQPDPKSGSVRQPDAAEFAAAEQRGYDRGVAEGHRTGWFACRTELLERLRGHLAGFPEYPDPAAVASMAAQVGTSSKRQLAPAADDKPRTEPSRAGANPKPKSFEAKSRETKSPSSAGELTGAARKLLAVLDTDPPVRRSWTQVATLAGPRAAGGHFNAGRKALRDAGLVVEAAGLVAIAEPSPGATRVDHDPDALIDIWCEVLKGAAPKILRVLGAPGLGRDRRDAHSRAAIAASLGMKPVGGHWNSAWKQLRDNGLAEFNGDVARLGDVFLPPLGESL